MPGYSGTPLSKKLGIKPGFRVAFSDLPADVHTELKPALSGCSISKAGAGPLDFGMIFVRSSAELNTRFPSFAKTLAPTGMLWVSWPKKSSGVDSDLDESIIRNFGLNHQLVDVKICAVSDVWSGLKFVIRLKDRKTWRSATK